MGKKHVATTDELMIEFELCIGLIFKPLRHHLQSFVDAGIKGELASVWKCVLSVLEDLLGDASSTKSPAEEQLVISIGLKETMDNLANEHLQNAVKVLMSAGVLSSELAPGDVAGMTLENVKKMVFATDPPQRISGTEEPVS